MGERLCISVHDGQKTVFNVYFHWSGYTCSALKLSADLMAGYRKLWGFLKTEYGESRQLDPKSVALSAALRVWPKSGIREMSGEMEMTGQQLWELIKKMGFDASIIYGDPVGRNRNAGLIAITPEEMAETDAWAENVVEIKLQPDGSSLIVRFDPLDMEVISEYSENFDGEIPDYQEIPDGVARYYDGDLTENEAYRLIELFEKAPGFAIGNAKEDIMLIRKC